MVHGCSQPIVYKVNVVDVLAKVLKEVYDFTVFLVMLLQQLAQVHKRAKYSGRLV